MAKGRKPKPKTPTKELLVNIFQILKKEKFSSVGSLADQIGSNWRTIDVLCETLKELEIVEIKKVTKTKVVAFRKNLDVNEHMIQKLIEVIKN